MTVIRFARAGCKKRPIFKIVVQDNRAPRDGKFIEHLGNFNPKKKDEPLEISSERLDHWIRVGAQISPSVRVRLKEKKLLKFS